MMPLWTRAMRAFSSLGEKCGWALCEAGAPWVAQRVWAMPVKPCRRFLDLRFEVGHARGAARARQAAVDVQGDAAGIIATVFEAFQAFDQDRGDIALGYCSDDAAHETSYKNLTDATM
jgi:hypothetical protein